MNDTIVANNGGRPKIPNRQGVYSKVVKHAQKAIDTIVELLDSRNEAIRLGAAKALLDKIIPDVKAVTSQEDATPITVRIVSSENTDTLTPYRNNSLGTTIKSVQA